MPIPLAYYDEPSFRTESAQRACQLQAGNLSYSSMPTPPPMPNQEPAPTSENNFTAHDVVQILREQNWHTGELTAEQSTWCEHAANLLGPQCVGRGALENLLSLVFHYDAQEILSHTDSHAASDRLGNKHSLGLR